LKKLTVPFVIEPVGYAQVFSRGANISDFIFCAEFAPLTQPSNPDDLAGYSQSRLQVWGMLAPAACRD